MHILLGNCSTVQEEVGIQVYPFSQPWIHWSGIQRACCTRMISLRMGQEMDLQEQEAGDCVSEQHDCPWYWLGLDLDGIKVQCCVDGSLGPGSGFQGIDACVDFAFLDAACCLCRWPFHSQCLHRHLSSTNRLNAPLRPCTQVLILIQ